MAAALPVKSSLGETVKALGAMDCATAKTGFRASYGAMVGAASSSARSLGSATLSKKRQKRNYGMSYPRTAKLRLKEQVEPRNESQLPPLLRRFGLAAPRRGFRPDSISPLIPGPGSPPSPRTFICSIASLTSMS